MKWSSCANAQGHRTDNSVRGARRSQRRVELLITFLGRQRRSWGHPFPQLMIPWMYAVAKETVASASTDGLELNGQPVLQGGSGGLLPRLPRPATRSQAGREIYNSLKY